MDEVSLELGEWVLEHARHAGASAAEVMMVSSESLGAAVRLGEVEKLKSSRERRLGIRVFTGQSAATASTAELERGSLERFIADTVELARLTAPDHFAGLPDPNLHPRTLPDLDLADRDHGIISAEQALKMAREAESVALKTDPRIKNSEGSEFDSGVYELIFMNSQGFSGSYKGSTFSLSAVVIAEADGAMQRDYWYSANRHFNQLETPEAIGRRAAQRTLRRLGAHKIKTTAAPVVFDPDMAAGLIRSLAGAASGTALYKRASFLLDRLGQQVTSPNATIIDDGTIAGLLGSRPFDGEGLPTRRKALVEKGELATYLLDCYSARKLGLAPTGNASRGLSDAPGVSPHNLYLEPGPYTPEQIIGSVQNGLYVTELIGFGVNGVTGDYSRGASGLWIENGELTHPVEEITIAGNLKEMYMAIEMVGNDLVWRSSVAAPTIKISEMTIAGS
ncbi:MAG TPA: metallopeptidase TldD-related protein [Candidatus Binataceae bacterium]|jgi:PmbA protein|nr:metallopeptidase TldD-related protein [Candidatus Binataceae bacterium]